MSCMFDFMTVRSKNFYYAQQKQAIFVLNLRENTIESYL